MEDQKNEIVKRASTLPEQAKRIIIKTNEDYLKAIEFLKGVKTLQLRINDTFDKITNAAWKAYKTAKAEKTKVESPLKEAEAIVEPLIAEWKRKKEEERLAEERRLQAEAKAKAEEEKLEDAIEAEKRGDTEEAAAILEEPTNVVPVIVQSTTPKTEGVHTQKVWKWRLIDIDKVPKIYFKLDEAKIGAVARSLKDKAQIDGVQVYYEEIVVVRGLDI